MQFATLPFFWIVLAFGTTISAVKATDATASSYSKGATATTSLLDDQEEAFLRGYAPSRDLQSCVLIETETLLGDLEANIAAAESCSNEVDDVVDIVKAAQRFAQIAEALASRSESIGNTVDNVQSLMLSLSPFTRKIPRVGPVINTIRNQLGNLADKVRRLGPHEERFMNVADKLGTTKTVLNAIKLSADGVKVVSNLFQDPLSRAAQCSSENDCIAASTIESFSVGVDNAFFTQTTEAFEVCTTVFSPIDTLLNSFELPDINILDDIQAVLREIERWLDELTGDLLAGATHALCCFNVISSFNDIIDGIADLVNLATCWVDGVTEGVTGEILDVIFQDFQVIADALNEIIGTANGVFSDLNGISIQYPTIPDIDLPSLNFDSNTCEVTASDFDLAFGFDTYSPNIALLDSVDFGFDGSFDISDIGDAIVEACNDALAALTQPDDVDCCDIARTCDRTHRITLYEGDNCDENVAGTLATPPIGGIIDQRANDLVCTANDESRSVHLQGPLPAGLRIEMSDNAGDICADDYASIVLTRALEEDEELCVPRFETSSHQVYEDHGAYVLSNVFANGLQGRVSRYIVHNPGSYSIEQTRPRCLKAITFFEANNCIENIVGTFDIPSSSITINAQNSDQLVNDEADSVRLLGPIDAGVAIRVWDEPGGSCGDDFGAILLTRALGPTDELCIGSFQRTRTSSSYQQIFHDHNGSLDGRVSRIRISRGSTTQHLNDCVAASRFTFFEENNCQGPISGYLTQLSGSYIDGQRGTPSLINDHAQSVAITGPMNAGNRVTFSDSPSGNPEDDWGSLVVTSNVNRNEEICIGSFNSNRFLSKARYHVSYINGLDGRVSEARFFNPSRNSYTTSVTRGLRWTSEFSEEGDAKSGIDARTPVVGARCSRNFCDNKRLLKATESTCRSSSSRITHSISEESSELLTCNENEMITGMRCTGSRCDNVRLICSPIGGGCRWGENKFVYPQWVFNVVWGSTVGIVPGVDYAPIANNAYHVAPDNKVLYGIGCSGSFCDTLYLFYRDMFA